MHNIIITRVAAAGHINTKGATARSEAVKKARGVNISRTPFQIIALGCHYATSHSYAAMQLCS